MKIFFTIFPLFFNPDCIKSAVKGGFYMLYIKKLRKMVK
ncbi:hypothetical protein NNO_2084 [Hydrogenimonas sp.]|nr:hypothetical protein NNO_2084 [Hydrogenimonas sp.]